MIVVNTGIRLQSNSNICKMVYTLLNYFYSSVLSPFALVENIMPQGPKGTVHQDMQIKKGSGGVFSTSCKKDKK